MVFACFSHNEVVHVLPMFHLSSHGVNLHIELCPRHLDGNVFRDPGARLCDGVDAMSHVIGPTPQITQGLLRDFETWGGLENDEMTQYQPKAVGESTASDQHRFGILAHDSLDHNVYPCIRHGGRNAKLEL